MKKYQHISFIAADEYVEDFSDMVLDLQEEDDVEIISTSVVPIGNGCDFLFTIILKSEDIFYAADDEFAILKKINREV